MRLLAAVGTESGETQARLLDLSRNGALVQAMRPPPPGTRCTLTRERFQVAATVRWARGGRFGLRFDEGLRVTDLFFQLGRSRAGDDESAATPPASAAPARWRSTMA